MQHRTLYCGSLNQHSTVTLLSAFGTDVSFDIFLSVFSKITWILRWRSHNGLFLPPSVLLTFMAFFSFPASQCQSLILFFNSLSPTKCHLPLYEITFLVTLLLKEWDAGICLSRSVLSTHAHNPSVLWAPSPPGNPSHCKHLPQELCWGHVCSALPAWAWSLLIYSLVQSNKCSISIQSHVTQQSCSENFWTHSDHQG